MLFGPPKHKKTLFRESAEPAKADRYMTDEYLKDPRIRRMHAIEERLVRDHLDCLPPGAVVADVPCGNGRMGQWVAGRGDLRLVALDYGLEMLHSMETRQIPALLRRRARADITVMPLGDKSVDLFINMRLMHHIPERETRLAMCREIARVTRGPIITSFWSTRSWRYLKRRARGREIRGFPISPAQFVSVCRDSGLVVERVIPTHRWIEEQCLAICRTAEVAP